MARIAGVDIPRDKRVVISLTYVYGIGKSTAKETVTLDDGWTVITKDHSLAAHYEHTIVITDDGYRILTKL